MLNISKKTILLMRENAQFHLTAINCEQPTEEIELKKAEISDLIMSLNHLLETIKTELYHEHTCHCNSNA